MEGRGGMTTSGVTVVGSDAPTDYHVAPRTEVPGQAAGSAAANQPVASLPSAAATSLVKKKRGRPRKYGPDGGLAAPLSPKPISSSAPALSVLDISSAAKPGKGRGSGSASKHQQPPKFVLDGLGKYDWVACSVGANFTPHIIAVNSGEDVTLKVISFSQQGPRAICILSANGVISCVTLRQPDSSGGTLTYEGRFEILSLSGSFMVTDNGGTRSRSGGMSISLASPDGRVVGGSVAGLLVAASPVQVVVGSFLTGEQHEQRPKKQRPESISMAMVPLSGEDMREEAYGGQGQHGSAAAKTNLSSSSSFRGDNWSPMPPDSRKQQTDINVSVPGG